MRHERPRESSYCSRSDIPSRATGTLLLSRLYVSLASSPPFGRWIGLLWGPDASRVPQDPRASPFPDAPISATMIRSPFSVTRRLLHGLALSLAFVSVSCKCPGFFNSNCEVALDLVLDSTEVNDGKQMEVSVLGLRKADFEKASEITVAEWFNYGKSLEFLEQAHRLDFAVAKGEIRLVSDASPDAACPTEGEEATILFRNLKNPEEFGVAHFLVFADYTKLGDNKPLKASYGEFAASDGRPKVHFGKDSARFEFN